MLKRFVCLLLAVSLCAIPFVVPHAAEELEVLPQNIAFLQDLGILEEIPEVGLYERRVYYTREKLAKTLSMMLLSSEPVIIQEPEIRDVAGNEYINYIDFVVTQDLMKLDTKLMFHPKDYVTLDMAVYGMVNALEYHPLAEELGGTAEAYLSVAVDIGLLRKVDIKDPERITIFELGEMVDNAMRITPMVQKDEIITCIKPTLLEQKELFRKSGRILANTNVGLSIDKAPRGYVNIDGKLYPTKLVIEDITVGAIVTYYTQKIDNKEHVISYYATSDEGVLSLDADEIEGISFTDSSVKLTYDEEEEAVIDRRAFVLVNGKNYSLTPELFDVFTSGTINMRDSDDNGTFDVVYMDLYRTEVIGAVGAGAKNIITKYYNQSIKLEPVGDGLRIIKENKEIDVSELAIGQVISVSCDAFTINAGQLTFDYNNATKLTIRVSDKTVTGVVTQTVDGSNYIVVDDIKYEASSYLKKAYDDGKVFAVQPGQPVVLYLDIYDKVITHEVNSKENLMEYGYLIDAAVNTQGLNQNLMLKLLCEDGKIRIFDAAKTYLLNGVTVKKHSLTGSYGENLDTRQLIRYRVQNEMVKEIDTVQVNPLVESSKNSLSRDYTSGATSLSYRFGNFGWKVVMLATTPAFNVPDPSATEVDDSQFVRVSTATTVQDKSYKIDAYDMDDRLVAGCILRYSATAVANYGDKDVVYMISDVCRAVGPDGLPTTQLTLLDSTEGGETIVYFADDVDCRLNHGKQYGNASAEQTGNELTAADFKRGDLIRYLPDDNGMVANIERVFRYSASEPTKPVAYGSGGAYGVSYSAFAYNVNLDYLTVCMNKNVASATPEEFCAIPTSRFKTVPVYNVNEDEVYLEKDVFNTPSYSGASNTMLWLQTYTSEIMGAFAYCLD
ncbi:MAG: hypothetical protein E7400_00930 [Ruminococcaceae bacterium]|nr:hypothetical protein [Oscillospiraceae bacterium]